MGRHKATFMPLYCIRNHYKAGNTNKRGECLLCLKLFVEAKNKKQRDKYIPIPRKPKQITDILAYQREWIKSHPEFNRYKASKNRAKRKQAIPKWANLIAIKNIYKQARLLELQFGERYHVDHIIPLANDLVCGLHVETNLQILSAKENLVKNNSFNTF